MLRSPNAPVSLRTRACAHRNSPEHQGHRRRAKSEGQRRFTKNKIQCRIPTMTLKNSCKLPDQNVAFWGYFQARLPAKGGDGFSIPYGGSHMTEIRPRKSLTLTRSPKACPPGREGCKGSIPRASERMIHMQNFHFPCGLGKGPGLWSHGFLGSNLRSFTYWQTMLT